MSQNIASVLSTLGARNLAQQEREVDDYYATDPKALELILPHLQLNNRIWECACGEGHLSKVLEAKGFDVKSTDLIDRGYGLGGVDFLSQSEPWQGDILTNPPFKLADKFVRKGIELLPNGGKMVLFLKLQFLESKLRRALFKKYPPKEIWVSSNRLRCALGGDFARYANSNAVAYAWYVWEKGFAGDPIVRWFN